MFSRLVSFVGGLVMCAVWFAMCWPVGYAVGFAYEKPHVPITCLVFVVTLALAALRTHYARLGDDAEGTLAHVLSRERHYTARRGMHIHEAWWGPLLHIALVVLTSIPAIGVGMLYTAIAPEDE